MITIIPRIVALQCILAAAVAVAADARDSKGPPELAIAVMIDGGVLEVRLFTPRWMQQTDRSGLPPYVKAELVKVIEAATTRINANHVRGRRVDGTAVSERDLFDNLKSPTPVILLKPGEQLDSLYSKLFKPDALVLTW